MVGLGDLVGKKRKKSSSSKDQLQAPVNYYLLVLQTAIKKYVGFGNTLFLNEADQSLAATQETDGDVSGKAYIVLFSSVTMLNLLKKQTLVYVTLLPVEVTILFVNTSLWVIHYCCSSLF